MSRLVSCGRCGKPNPKALCDSCRGATYGSAEYQQNSARIKHMARVAIGAGIRVVCVICGTRITSPDDVTIEHMRSVMQGGSNALGNLGPAHARCNYSKRAAQLLHVCPFCAVWGVGCKVWGECPIPADPPLSRTWSHFRFHFSERARTVPEAP